MAGVVEIMTFSASSTELPAPTATERPWARSPAVAAFGSLPNASTPRNVPSSPQVGGAFTPSRASVFDAR